eukprot:scaffold15312_cov66-Phaeocystis_antarctica.AAC.1
MSEPLTVSCLARGSTHDAMRSTSVRLFVVNPVDRRVDRPEDRHGGAGAAQGVGSPAGGCRGQWRQHSSSGCSAGCGPRGGCCEP